MNDLTIKSALSGLREKKFSSLELTNFFLERIRKFDKDINSFILVSEESALESARKADEKILRGDKSPLLGIPIALKEMYSTKDLKTTAASKVLDDYVPQYSATSVDKLTEAGAVILGKTNCDAWAHGSSGENSDFGVTKNPYDKNFVPGGSSSGSATSLAADFCLATTGTDTGGSIRLPASFTNVVGLKPTYGRVSRYGVLAMASSLDSIGHFTKTVEDSALILEVTSGKDPKDATTPYEETKDYLSKLGNGVKGLRIGKPKEYFVEGVDKRVRDKIEEALGILENLGAEILDISLPHTEYSIACYYIIQTAEVSSNLARYDGIRYGNDRSFFGEEAERRIMLGTFVLSSGYYDAYYKKALKVRTLLRQDFDKAFEKVDLIASPVSPSLPWKIGEKADDPLSMYLSDLFTVTANLTGNPALSLPAGFSDGLPVGLQIIAPHFKEEMIFQAAHALEKETEYYKKHPDL